MQLVCHGTAEAVRARGGAARTTAAGLASAAMIEAAPKRSA